MKSLFFFFLLFGSFYGVSFADDTIQFEVSSEKLELWDDITMSIKFESPENAQKNLQIDIPGLESFEVFSQGQSFSFESVNGEVQSMLQYTIVASANTPGTFTLWPVVIGSGSGALRDESVFDISVTEKNNPLQSNQNNSEDTLTSDQVSQTSEIYWPQKDLILLIFFLFFAFLVFAFPVFFLLKKYFAGQNIGKKPFSEKISQEEVPEISHRDFFQDLLKNSDTLSHEVFFESFNGKIRDIFGSILGSDIQYKTLWELKMEKYLTSHPLFAVFEKSYMLQYHPQGVDIKQRQELCESILSLL